MIDKVSTPHIDYSRKMNRWYIFSSYRELLVMFAYVVACISYYISWYQPSLESTLRYVMGFALLASIKWTGWDYSKVALILFLLVSLVALRLLVVWIFSTLSTRSIT